MPDWLNYVLALYEHKLHLIPIMISICAIVISTGGLRSSPKWRNLL